MKESRDWDEAFSKDKLGSAIQMIRISESSTELLLNLYKQRTVMGHLKQ